MSKVLDLRLRKEHELTTESTYLKSEDHDIDIAPRRPFLGAALPGGGQE